VTQPDPVKVIYVMCAGHSGSSILGVTLGNCSGFFYAGEVEEWLVSAGASRWGGADRRSFWNRVRERVGAGATDLFGSAANRCVERSSVLLRVDRWPARRRLLSRYRRVAEDLLRAISSEAGAPYVVDSSHFPLRARELEKIAGIELYLVFLVRDPQAVVASNVRHIRAHELAERRYRVLAMNCNLWLTHFFVTRSSSRIPMRFSARSSTASAPARRYRTCRS
jgi:hypothetical protein